jgi:hypothetical protein
VRIARLPSRVLAAMVRRALNEASALQSFVKRGFHIDTVSGSLWISRLLNGRLFVLSGLCHACLSRIATLMYSASNQAGTEVFRYRSRRELGRRSDRGVLTACSTES